MTLEEFEANMLELKGRIKAGWGHLTDDEIAIINGEFDQFVGKLKKKLAADRDLHEFQMTNEK